MKKFLLSVVAMSALTVSNGAAHAQSTWLVILYGKSFDQNGSVGASLEKIEMTNLETCQVEGEKWLKSESIRATSDRGYHCVEGK